MVNGMVDEVDGIDNSPEAALLEARFQASTLQAEVNVYICNYIPK